MSKEGRLTKSIRNSYFVTISQFVNIVLGFVLQTIFIKTLGGTYLGIKGLFTNILSVLSFSELGIGSAITFALYAPLANREENKISAIMHFFKRAYEFIGCFIGVIGICLIPFIHYFTHVYIRNLYLYYLLFLANTVISYFFTYKRTLLNADQKNYLNTINQLIFKLIQVVGQIIILLAYKSFILFLIIQLLCTFFSNLIISVKVNKQYPYIIGNDKENKVDTDTKKIIFSNTIGSVGEKIGTIIVQSTDNMLISYFISLFVGGIYSNYLLVTSSLTAIVGQASSAVSASIGNLAVERKEDVDHQYDTLKKFFFVDHFIVFIVSVCLLTMLNPFIRLWVGARYEFPFFTVFLLVVNFAITGLRSPLTSFVGAYGLYARDGVKSVIEAVLNLSISIFYVKILNMGVNGIILGTITSNILCNWYEPYVVIRYGMRISSRFKEFILIFIGYLLLDIVVMLGVYRILSNLFIVRNFIQLFCLGFLTLLSSFVLFVLIFGRNKYFKFLVNLVKKVVLRK